MYYLFLVAISAGISSSLFRKRNRPPVVGALLGALFPLLGIFIAWKMKPLGLAIDQRLEEPLIQAPASAPDSIGSTKDPSQVIQSKSGVLMIPATGYYSFDVAGESHHFAELRQVVKELGGAGEHQTIAHLVPEPTNKYDHSAVRVEVHGKLCGYIAKEENSEFKALFNLAQRTSSTLAAHARVWSGRSMGGQGDWIASVSLDIGRDFSRFFPVNNPPEGAIIWPSGGHLKVNILAEAEPEIQKILALAYVKGECSIYLNVVETIDEAGKPVVGLLFEEIQIATLSPVTSHKLLPILSKIPPTSAIVVLCHLSGNAIASELKVDLLSPEKLSDSQIRQLGIAV